MVKEHLRNSKYAQVIRSMRAHRKKAAPNYSFGNLFKRKYTKKSDYWATLKSRRSFKRRAVY